jgi:serine/threonine protein kinase
VSQEQGGQTAGEDRVVGARYLVLNRLGAGGFGRVWRARDTVLDIDVAVKQLVVPPDVPGDGRAELLARARREAANAARLRGDPNIVSVHDLVIDDGEPWLVMELLNGHSLAEELRVRGSLAAAEAAGIARAVLLALASCHSVGIIHRDVKPANVMLCDEGRVVLADFGISMLTTDNGLTATGQFVGTVDYIAPERISGEKARPASDMFSLGAMLYHMVEGVPPFRRETAAATVGAVMFAEPVPPLKAGNLAPVIGALLAKNPDARPGAEHALRLLDGQPPYTATQAAWSPQPAGNAPTSAPSPSQSAHGTPPPSAPWPGRPAATAPPPTPTRVRRPAASHRRRRWLVVPACALLLAAVTVTAFLLTRARGAAAPAPLASWLHTATFNGKDNQLVLPGAALDTRPGASFTVSAWVDLSSTRAFATAVSQDAAVKSSFYLQYSLANGTWAFTRFKSNAAGAAGVRAVAGIPPVIGRWTHLVGVYNSADGRLSLYVDGILRGTARDALPFGVRGTVIIGRARSAGRLTDWFPGQIKDVEVFQQALGVSQIKALP